MAVIKVNDVHKKFRLYPDKGNSLKEKLLFRSRTKHEDHWVLRGVSFEVERGEAIGLIGENGSGKSTLLKLMSRIMYPDKGSIEIQGRVSSLIELGAGFHPNMSGRENIYTNAAIFGLTRREIDSRLQTIIDFSELGEYIDAPVRTYSSGMYMRLAFSVAINVDADVLLIDEILAVGDANFQAKCFDMLREVKRRGINIVIVSHSLSQIEQICDRTIWIDNGAIREEGLPNRVHPAYLEFMGNKTREAGEKQAQTEEVEGISPVEEEVENIKEDVPEQGEQKDRWGIGGASITKVSIIDDKGKPTTALQTGKAATIRLSYRCAEELVNPVAGVLIYRNDNVYCYGTNTQIDRLEKVPISGEGNIIFSTEQLALLPGKYYLDVAISSQAGFDYDYWRNCLSFSTYSEIEDIGIFRVPHTWIFQ